jgi:hypothetical protein
MKLDVRLSGCFRSRAIATRLYGAGQIHAGRPGITKDAKAQH